MKKAVLAMPAARRAAWAVALVATAGAPSLFAAGAFNGPGVPVPQASLGSIVAVPDGCLVEFTATIHTEAGGGQDAFEVQVFDDGQVIRNIDLAAAADGATHDVSSSFRLSGPPGDLTPGIGLYLVDNGQILDLIDPLGVPCTILEVPALGRGGFFALGGLLALAALALMARLRRA